MSNTRKRPSNSIRDRVVDFRRVPASQLVPNPKNWRVHNDAQVQAFQSLVSSIGFAGAELVREMPDGRLMLIDGHMRADTLGDMPVPCLVTDLSEHEADALLATFDPIGRLAGTDQDAAAALIESLGVAGYDAAADLLRAVADNDQTSALLESLADGMLGGGGDGESHDVDDPSGGGDDFDTTPDASGPTRVQPGDIWALGEHRLLCGDSTKREDVARLMDGERITLVFSDPPFNVGYKSYADNRADYAEWLAAWIDAAYEILEPDATFYVMNIPRNLFITQCALEHGGTFQNLIVWPHGTGLIPSTRFAEQWTAIVCYRVGEPTFNPKAETCEAVVSDERGGGVHHDGRLNDIWDDVKPITAGSRASAEAILKDGSKAKVHGAQMPLKLPMRAINFQTLDGDSVYDAFLGSGTTLIAAERTGRRCYGMELEPRYCDVILRRWEAETGRTATLLERISEPEHATATA